MSPSTYWWLLFMVVAAWAVWLHKVGKLDSLIATIIAVMVDLLSDPFCFMFFLAVGMGLGVLIYV